MPARSRATLKKRQREIARMEKQRDKAAKRMQRKLLAKQHHEEQPGDLTESAAELTEQAGEPAAAADVEKLPDA
jgi:hypothetical protein